MAETALPAVLQVVLLETVTWVDLSQLVPLPVPLSLAWQSPQQAAVPRYTPQQ